MVVLFITAIMLAMGSLQFASLDSAAKNSTAWQIFEADVSRARTEASARGTRIIIRPEGDGYIVGQDIQPYNDPAAEDSILYTRILPTGITASFSNSLLFDSRGVLVAENDTPTEQTVTFLRGTQIIRAIDIPSFGGDL